MKYIRIIILGITLSFCVNFTVGQAVKPYLQKVLANNPWIQQAKQQMEAERSSQLTGITPPGPELEAGYFPGKDNVVKRTFGVSQRFEMPMVYSRKLKTARSKQEISKAVYQQRMMDILLEASKKAIQYKYTHNVLEVLESRKQHAEELLAAFEKSLEQGDANLLEVNKIRVAQLNVTERLAYHKQKLASLKAEIRQFVNGESVDFEKIKYPEPFVLSRNEYVNLGLKSSPNVLQIKQKLKTDSIAVKLSKAQNWPSFKVGYEYEAADPEQFSGIKAGISIPLWQNSKKTKTARARVMASSARNDAIISSLKTQLVSTYNEYRQVTETHQQYSKTMNELQSFELLKKSLDFGHISLIEYLLELKFFYEANDRLLELAYEQAILNAELRRFEYMNLQ
ncbi:Outer membrane efflux protein [Salinivirga cyanobacteriivorans]|uniref:Outer membrane efflux protein n=1 Tax=Salinivirga cyanobacteriivorans TaxID=1307839 RepID=A0A0S2HWN5_9BACT|nr:TolC family protein [Salinivirga cyanobacteriivorans]ALO14429.1 Outer membrane efflux protein [Salinivirga cyanobacteriivorans]